MKIIKSNNTCIAVYLIQIVKAVILQNVSMHGPGIIHVL